MTKHLSLPHTLTHTHLQQLRRKRKKTTAKEKKTAKKRPPLILYASNRTTTQPASLSLALTLSRFTLARKNLLVWRTLLATWTAQHDTRNAYTTLTRRDVQLEIGKGIAVSKGVDEEASDTMQSATFTVAPHVLEQAYKAIRTTPPEPKDLEQSVKLQKFMDEFFPTECDENITRRSMILAELRSIFREWVKQVRLSIGCSRTLCGRNGC